MNFRDFHFPNLRSDELDEALESSHWKWSAFAPISVRQVIDVSRDCSRHPNIEIVCLKPDTQSYMLKSAIQLQFLRRFEFRSLKILPFAKYAIVTQCSNWNISVSLNYKFLGIACWRKRWCWKIDIAYTTPRATTSRRRMTAVNSL